MKQILPEWFLRCIFLGEVSWGWNMEKGGGLNGDEK